MVSALDLAYLSDDVYEDTNSTLSGERGFTRLNSPAAGDGFAAITYQKNDELVVAFRGTNDMADALSDARMVPSATTQQIASVTPRVLQEYGLSDRPELLLGGALLTQILTSPRGRVATALFADQVPPEQTRQAEQFLDSVDATPDYLTGHSLGGALAKVMTLRRGIPCVGFNSPFMGSLRGVTPVSSAGILSINAKGDPLSIATRQVGNLPHGRTITVDTGDYPTRPPPQPEVETYTRPDVCPRTGQTNWTSPESIVASAASAACEATVDALEPIGRAVTSPRRYRDYWFRQYPAYVSALLSYMGDVALHFHGIGGLRTTMAGMPRFRRELT